MAVVGSEHCSPTGSDGSGWRLNLLTHRGRGGSGGSGWQLVLFTHRKR